MAAVVTVDASRAADPGPSGPDPAFKGLYVSLAMYDNCIEDEDLAAIRLAAGLVADAVRSGRRTLVHCAQGWNRSGLVSARALMYLGLSVHDAIAEIRAARGDGALSNSSYAAWLVREEAR